MKCRVSSLVVVLVAMWVLTTAMPAYAQNATVPTAAQSRTIDPAEAAANQASGKIIDETQLGAPILPANKETAVACTICNTCGGDWPIWEGAISADITRNLTYERGGGCAGAIGSGPHNDANPYLCCR
jgi:hypothetical protein